MLVVTKNKQKCSGKQKMVNLSKTSKEKMVFCVREEAGLFLLPSGGQRKLMVPFYNYVFGIGTAGGRQRTEIAISRTQKSRFRI